MELNVTQFLSGLGCGICIGISLVAFRSFSNIKSQARVIKKFASRSEYKLVLVVRTDLNMTKGKIAAQCGHAAVAAYESALKDDPEGLQVWQMTGQAKIALKTDSLDEIKKITNNAKEMGVITSVIQDDGRTQVAHGSVTVVGVGPAPKNVIDQITGHLKLL